MIEDLFRKNRSCRRFFQQQPIPVEVLTDLINLARLSPSAANRQPLAYILSNDPNTNEAIFPCLGWAAYLKNWPGPKPGEQPAAYIIILGDTRITKQFCPDDGIAAHSILLGTRDQGLGGCMIASIKKKALRQVLSIASHYEILLVAALGKPKESALIETVGEDGDIRYWRDKKGVHHVPKRALTDIVLKVYTQNNKTETG